MCVTEFTPFKQVMERRYRTQNRGSGYYFAYSLSKGWLTFMFCGDKDVGEIYSL